MLKIFFSIIFFYNSVQIYQYVKDKYSYQYEDWLINYSNGFVRRGFTGEILIQLVNFFNFNLQFFLFVFLFSLIAILYYFSYKLLNKIKLNNFSYLFLIFSPFFFIFYMVNHNSGIRKEFLIFIFFCILASKINFNNIKEKLWIFSFSFPLLVLIHEGLMFYFPLYALSVILFLNNKNFKFLIFQLFISFFLSSLIFYFSFLYKGSEEYVLIICESLKSYVKDTCVTGGAINHLKDKLVPATLHVLKEHDIKSVFQWVLMMSYGYAPIFYIFYKSKFKKNQIIENFLNLNTKKVFIIFLTISFLSTFPLFIIAFDWGRWLSIFYHIISFTILFLLNNNILRINNKPFKRIDKKIIIILLVYATFVTPSVFDKKSSNVENVYNLNYIKLIKKHY